MFNICGKNYKAWLGLRSLAGKDNFTWLDKSALGFSKWYGGHPTGVGERCGFLDTDNTWMSSACNQKYAAVCEEYRWGVVDEIHGRVNELHAKLANLSAIGELAKAGIAQVKSDVMSSVKNEIHEVQHNHKLNINVMTLEQNVEKLQQELNTVRRELELARADDGVEHNLLHEQVNKIISKPVISSPDTQVNTVQRQQAFEGKVNVTIEQLKVQLNELISMNSDVNGQLSEVSDDTSELKGANSTALFVAILAIVLVLLVAGVLLYLINKKKKRIDERKSSKGLMNGGD